MSTYQVRQHYQKQGIVVTKYYHAVAERVAMRQSGVLYYIFGDHLGSTAVVKNTQGGKTELRYTAWGTTRYEYGSTPTDRRFTGQREEASFGLYFYNARWYDPALGRFIQADTIVPGAGNPQAWDRYAYVNNDPVNYSDPSGNYCVEEENGYEEKRDCKTVGFYEDDVISRLTRAIKYSDRSNFEKNALLNLLGAGEEGQSVVGYMISNNVGVGFRWHLYAGATWDADDKIIYLNTDQNTVSPDNPFVLNLIAHEAVHLEQTLRLAATKWGEIEAWKIGFTVQNNIVPFDEKSIEYRISDLNMVSPFIIEEGSSLIKKYNETSISGWMYNAYFNILPNYPYGIYY